MNLSNLKICSGGVLPWSGGNCEQTLSPVTIGDLWRTVNGSLVYVSNASQDKYRSVITSTDKLPPAFENIERGQEVEIHCITELWQNFSEHNCTLKRPYVEDSLQATDERGKPVDFVIGEDGTFLCEVATGFAGYRPILKMLVTDIVQETQEWEFNTKWKLVSEEI